MKLEIKYDKKADSVYLYFSDKKVAYSRKLDKERTVDYSEEGEIRGIEFLSATSGVKTDDLPHRSAIERALYDKGIARIMHKHDTNRDTEGSHRDSTDSGEALLKMQMKARTTALMWTIVTTLFFIGIIAADILFARNIFVLDSLPGLLASMLGLVVALFPTVLGGLILLAWVFYTRSQASRL